MSRDVLSGLLSIALIGAYTPSAFASSDLNFKIYSPKAKAKPHRQPTSRPPTPQLNRLPKHNQPATPLPADASLDTTLPSSHTTGPPINRHRQQQQPRLLPSHRQRHHPPPATVRLKSHTAT